MQKPVTNGDVKSAVATPDGRSRKKKKKLKSVGIYSNNVSVEAHTHSILCLCTLLISYFTHHSAFFRYVAR